MDNKAGVIAVCDIEDYNIKNIKLIIRDSNMFQARITVIKHANYEKVLLLDSEQIPETGLLEEFDKRGEHIVVILEKSLDNNLTSKCWMIGKLEIKG